MENKVDSQVKDSGIKVGEIVRLDGNKVIFRRQMPVNDVANDIATRIKGEPVRGWNEIVDKNGRLLDADTLEKRGCTIVVMDYDAVLSMNKTGNPFFNNGIRRAYTVRGLTNVIWNNVIRNEQERQGVTDVVFTSDDTKANGVKDLEGCRGVGETRAKNPTINYIPMDYLADTRYYDASGRVYTRDELSPWIKGQSQASKQKEADKHGLTIETDKEYRTMRIDNCKAIRVFGFEYVPTV